MEKLRLNAFAPCLSLAFVLPHQSFADLPIGKCRDIVVPSFRYYIQTGHFDINGNRIKGRRAPGHAARITNFGTEIALRER